MQPIGKIMEEQLSHLEVEKAQGPSSLSTPSKTTSQQLEVREIKIIGLKYVAKQFGQMDQVSFSAHTKALLIKIHVITGWTVPQGELMNILVDQFQQKLAENYPTMNPDEVEYAFRSGGTTVKDWGKAMNLALIDEVLIPYLEERKRLSHELEERKAPPAGQRIYSQDELWNIHRGDVEYFYQRLLNGYIPNKIPDYFTVVLEHDGLKTAKETLDEFFHRRIKGGSKNIYLYEVPNKTND